MADQRDKTRRWGRRSAVSRRKFIEGMTLAASAATGLAALPNLTTTRDADECAASCECR